MKNGLLLVLMILSIACQNDENIGPLDLLYQRWHLDRTMRIGDDAWIMYDMDGYYDTEYRPDGTLIYRKNGVVIQTCCSPEKFNLKGSTLVYSDYNTCPNVRCASIKQTTVTHLTSDLLELNDGIYITQYRSVK